MNRVLLDTNVYSALRTGQPDVLDRLGKASSVFVSAVVLGELHAGFQSGTRLRQNQDSLGQFLALPEVSVANLTEETAEHYGWLMAKLRKTGTPLPTNDVWLGAQAIEMRATVMTFDKHFRMMPGLRIWPALSERE
jgi:tRNA(fMet)-specific endonuclease VapC